MPPKVIVENVNKLVTAKQYADSGQFEEASKMCNEFLSEKGPNATAYFLLGLIAHALEKENEA